MDENPCLQQLISVCVVASGSIRDSVSDHDQATNLISIPNIEWALNDLLSQEILCPM